MYEPSKEELDDLEMAFSSASKSELKKSLYYIEALYGSNELEEADYLIAYLTKRISEMDEDDVDMWNYSAGESETEIPAPTKPTSDWDDAAEENE